MSIKSRLTLAMVAGMAMPIANAAVPPTQQLKDFAFGRQPDAAKSLFESTRPKDQTLGAEWLAAMSWVARAGAIGSDWDMAADYAEATLKGCERLLDQRALDKDPNAPFPIALGAAIETMAKFYDAKGDRGQAVAFLRDQRKRFAGTSVETRLNKNLLLLDLAGKPMPNLDAGQTLGSVGLDSADLKDKVTLFFFWAHWCSDCREQKPILVELQRRYASRGLVIVAPTRLYGYVQDKRGATPSEEQAYMVAEHVREHPLLSSVPIPLSGKNFVDFGVSTTPTLVLVDRQGVVSLYHPGNVGGEELAKRIEALL